MKSLTLGDDRDEVSHDETRHLTAIASDRKAEAATFTFPSIFGTEAAAREHNFSALFKNYGAIPLPKINCGFLTNEFVYGKLALLQVVSSDSNQRRKLSLPRWISPVHRQRHARIAISVKTRSWSKSMRSKLSSTNTRSTSFNVFAMERNAGRSIGRSFRIFCRDD